MSQGWKCGRHGDFIEFTPENTSESLHSIHVESVVHISVDCCFQNLVIDLLGGHKVTIKCQSALELNRVENDLKMLLHNS